MKFIFSNYVKIIKNVCKNPDISNEEIIRALFDIFDEDNEVDIDPSDATHIMKRETSIPKKIMQDLTDSIEKDVVENCNLFIEYYIDNKRFVEFKNKISSVLDCDKTVKEFVKDYINRSINDNNDIFLYRTLVEVLRVPNKLLDTKINLWKKGKNEINIYYGDIFRLAFGSKYKSEKKALVIPVNTTYDTKVNDDSRYCISSETLHGKWINNMLEHGYSINKINSIINQNLDKMPKKINDRIGGVVPFKYENVTFLLFAITTFIDGIATTNLKELKESITKLIRYYNDECQGMTLYIPLLGTGRSRVNLSYYESYMNIKEILFKNQNMIQGRVNILIYYKDAEEIEEEIDNEE